MGWAVGRWALVGWSVALVVALAAYLSAITEEGSGETPRPFFGIVVLYLGAPIVALMALGVLLRRALRPPPRS